MFRHNLSTTDKRSSKTTAEGGSMKRVEDSCVKRLLLRRNLLVVRLLIVALAMVLLSAAGLVRQLTPAAMGSAAIQLPALTAEGVVLDFDEGTHKKGEVI